MSVINKITELWPENGTTMSSSYIQTHLDENNTDGFELVAVDNMGNWYRFFWKKNV